MKNVKVAFQILEENEPITIGNQYMDCHIIFDVNWTVSSENLTEASTLVSFMAMPREGHFDALLHVFLHFYATNITLDWSSIPRIRKLIGTIFEMTTTGNDSTVTFLKSYLQMHLHLGEKRWIS
jgi:hypothetical protein